MSHYRHPSHSNTAHPTNDLLTIVSPRPPHGYNSSDHFQSSYGPLQNPNPHSRPSINGPPLSYPGGYQVPPTHLNPRTGISFPQKMYAWYFFSNSDGESYIELGPQAKSKDDIHYFIKISSIGTSLTSGGAKAEFGSDSAFGDRRWLLDMTINGKKEVWVWDANKQSLSQKPSGQNRGASLRRAGSSGPPAAIFTHEHDSMDSTRSTIGYSEFQGPALTGELGDDFQDVALLAWCRMTQKYLRRR
ncbi:hypothetical protein DL769_001304 [Monosporascus sp. CRB-8-3]|nr:hypothetical protein DL769_001304 [Monosporascus sp. CRB-8-3]